MKHTQYNLQTFHLNKLGTTFHKKAIGQWLVLLFVIFLPFTSSFAQDKDNDQIHRGRSTVSFGKPKKDTKSAPTINWNAKQEYETTKNRYPIKLNITTDYQLKPNMFKVMKNNGSTGAKINLVEAGKIDGKTQYVLESIIDLKSPKQSVYIAFEDGDLSSKSAPQTIYLKQETATTPSENTEDISLTITSQAGNSESEKYLLNFNAETSFNLDKLNFTLSKNGKELTLNKDLIKVTNKTKNTASYSIPLNLEEGSNKIVLTAKKALSTKKASRKLVVSYQKSQNNTDNNPIVSTPTQSQSNNPSVSNTPVEKQDDASVWTRASSKNNVKNYQQYLQKFPNGVYANQAKEKIDLLRWEAIQGDAKIERRIKKTEDFINNSYGHKTSEACIQIEQDLWDNSNQTENYDGYFAKLNWFFANCVEQKEKAASRNLPILGANLMGEGKTSTITFDNFIPPLNADNFDLKDSGISIEKIEENVVHFNIDDPKQKYNVSYSDALERSKDFVLGLEDYFKFSFNYEEENQNLFLNITGGKPPYFVQLNSSNYSKQIAFGNGPENTIDLKTIDDLPDGDIQVYITDVEKLVEKFAGEIKGKSKSGSFESLILLGSLLAFVLVSLFMYIKYRQYRKKQEAWENLGED